MDYVSDAQVGHFKLRVNHGCDPESVNRILFLGGFAGKEHPLAIGGDLEDSSIQITANDKRATAATAAFDNP